MLNSDQLELLRRLKQQRYVRIHQWSQRHKCNPLTKSELNCLISWLETLHKKSNA